MRAGVLLLAGCGGSGPAAGEWGAELYGRDPAGYRACAALSHFAIDDRADDDQWLAKAFSEAQHASTSAIRDLTDEGGNTFTAMGASDLQFTCDGEGADILDRPLSDLLNG